MKQEPIIRDYAVVCRDNHMYQFRAKNVYREDDEIFFTDMDNAILMFNMRNIIYLKIKEVKEDDVELSSIDLEE